MRLPNPDLPLMFVVLPIAVIGLWPLVLLPMTGFLGLVVFGVLIGFAAVMAQLEEQGAHTRQVIAHGSLSSSDQAGYHSEMHLLMRWLSAAKMFSATLIVVGLVGFFYA